MTATYLEAPRTHTEAPAWGSRLAADTRYVMTGFPRALAGLTLLPSRSLADAERARIARVLDEPELASTGRAGHAGHVGLRNPQTWRDLLHAVVRWAPNTISFSFVATWWAAALGGLSWSLWGWALPDGDHELPEMLGFGDTYMTTVGFYFALGLLFAVTLPAVARRAALLEARFARTLLSSR